MNRLPLPADMEMHSVDWRKYIEFWNIIYPGARSESVTTKPRKVTK